MADGGAVLLYSTEIEEVVSLSDRVMVFYGGKVAQTMERAQISEEAIMETALGHNQYH